MKVVHLQHHTASAGKQAIRLSNALLEAGIDSKVISLFSDDASNSISIHLGRKEKLMSRIDDRLQSLIRKNTNKDLGLYSYPILGTNIAKHPLILEADAVYLHWVLHGFLNLSSIESLAKTNKPIIIFMHDMWPITGGCHYSFECEKYITGCGNCPIFYSKKEDDLSKKEFRRKFKIYNKHKNIYFVSPSNWLLESAQQSGLTKNKPLYYIPNIVNNTIFKPFEKSIAKQILNIDTENVVVAFGAMSIDSPYKGWQYLQSALKILSQQFNHKKISILIFGSAFNEEINDSLPYDVKFLGYMKDDYSMSVIYNAADVFVAPSLADNLPTTIFESLSCGTPVVGFKTGGIPDLIQHKVNGYIANYRDSEDLAAGISFCLNHKINAKLSDVFNTNLTIEKHLNLLTKLQSKVNTDG